MTLRLPVGSPAASGSGSDGCIFMSTLVDEEDERVRIKCTETRCIIVRRPFLLQYRKEQPFTYDEVSFDSDNDGCYNIGGHIVKPEAGSDTAFLDNVLKKKSEADVGKTLCKAFLREVCEMTDEQFEEYGMFKGFRHFTKDDVGFNQMCPSVTDCCAEDTDVMKRSILSQDFVSKYYEPPADWYSMCLHYPDEDKAIDEHWCFCYHGTRPTFVSSIIKNRLVIPGNRTEDGTLVKILPGHIPGMNYIYTSPSIHYSSHYVYARPVEWDYVDPETGETTTYYVRTVFQVRQKPRTFSIQRNTLHPSCWDEDVLFDDNFGNEELEWETSDSSTIVPKELLIHFSTEPVDELIEERMEERRRQGKLVKTFDEIVKDEVKKKFKRNLEEWKKKILWVDDVPDNNSEFVDIIEEYKVEVVQCLDTESALKELRENPDGFHCAITDYVREEKRTGDTEPKKYYEAGLDFIREAKKIAPSLDILMYSGWCRNNEEPKQLALEAGAKAVCAPQDISDIIIGAAEAAAEHADSD